MNELSKTKQWFEQAIPEPTCQQKVIQLGCHFEEVGEMANSVGDVGLSSEIGLHAELYKRVYDESVLEDVDRKELLDSLADQIVTAIGVAHMFGFDIEGALEEVNRSNFSKFEDGKPVFDANGKITKGKDYTPPQLEKFI